MPSHERMSERVRDVGQGVIVAFPDTNVPVAGNQVDTLTAYFFRVSAAQEYYREYTQLGSLNSDASDAFDFLGDTGLGSGDDIFRIEEDAFHLMHFGYSTVHPDHQVLESVSPQSGGNHAIDRDGSADESSPGDSRAFTDLRRMGNRFDPAAHTERVSFKNDDDGEFLQWGFHNGGANQLSASERELKFVGRGYKVHPIESEDTKKAMLRSVRQDLPPEKDEIPTVLVSPGGLTQYTPGQHVPDPWKGSMAMEISLS